MNTRARSAVSHLLSAVVLLIGLLTTSTAAAADGPAASGHGNVISAGDLRTFSFTVVGRADGTATGHADVKNRGMNIRLHIELGCYKPESSNRVIVSGLITQSSNPAQVAPGRIAVFGVEDNGEGAADPTDRITTIPDYAAPKSCHDFTFVGDTMRELANPGVIVRPLIAILDGNIQVPS